MIRYGATIVPDPAASEHYRKLWVIYRDLYPSLKDSVNALSDLA